MACPRSSVITSIHESNPTTSATASVTERCPISLMIGLARRRAGASPPSLPERAQKVLPQGLLINPSEARL